MIILAIAIAFIVGVWLGVFAMGALCANSRADHEARAFNQGFSAGKGWAAAWAERERMN